MKSKSMRRACFAGVLILIISLHLLLWWPLKQPANAETGLTLGVAVDGSGLFSSPDLSEELGSYLEGQLTVPVKVRNFTTESYLLDWLRLYSEVDVAWLSDDFLKGVPAGELYVLAKNLDHAPGVYKGSFVARRGLDLNQRGRVLDALMNMHAQGAGQQLLAKVEVSRFVSASRWQTEEWVSPAVVEAVAVPETKQANQPLEVTPVLDVVAKEPENQKFEEQEQGAPATVVVPSEKAAPKPEAPVEEDVARVSQPKAEDEQLPAIEVEQESTKKDTTAAVTTEPVADVQEVSPVEMPAKKPAPKMPLVPADEEKPIALAADYLAYNSEDDSYEAKGDVVLQQAGVELTAETLLWQAATQDAAAEGDVRLKDADTEVSGGSLQYNMATGQGQVRDGKVFIREGNFHLSGELVEKHGQADYFVSSGSFTTCDGEVPDWKFTASEVDVTLGGYAEAKHVWFRVKDIPVFYTPYLLFPVKSERESGLLAPMFGYSNNKGVRASMAWYQVIDRHLDATIFLDYLSEIGLGKGVEYRYALPHGNNGEALYYHVTGLQDTQDLYYLDWKHSGELPAGWRLKADIEYADDKLFFEEFGETADQYNRDETVSTLVLQRNWQKFNLTGYARYLKDLDKSNDTTLQTLPEVGLSLARYRLGETPFYASLESYATHFSRREGEDGERFMLRPALSAVFKPRGWLEIVPEVAWYQRLYNVDSATDEEGGVAEFSLTATTRLVKVYEFSRWGVDRIQHSVEPKVTYRYVPDEDQDDLPLFDVFDRIAERNDVTYSLVNRLTTRSTAEDGSKLYREVFYLRLSQGYDIDEARNNTSGEDQPFSDLRFELDLSPTPYLSFNADGLMPVYGGNRLNRLSAGSTVSDGAGNSARVSYTYRDEEYAGTETDYVRFNLSTSLAKPLYVNFEDRYDFREGRELEKSVGLEYRSKCWSLLLTYRNRYRPDGDDDHEVGLAFVLSGLGRTPGLGGGFSAVDR